MAAASPTEVDAAPTGADLLRARLRALVGRLHELDPALRQDPTASVHAMRLVVRRLRSTLASFRRVFVPMSIEPIRQELSWLGSLLGDVRDQEAVAETLQDASDPAPAALARLDARLAEARARLATGLDSPRYAALVGGLDALAHDPPFTRRAARPADELVRAQARRDWARIKALVDDLPPRDDPSYETGLHDIRKAAKRLQYLIETGEDVLGPEGQTLLRDVRAFQTRLGEHRDAALASQLVAEAGGSPHELHRRASDAVDDVPALWHRLKRAARRTLA